MNELYEFVKEFARNNGTVTAYRADGTPTLVRDGEPDIIKIVELDADWFQFQGRRYTRPQFMKLIDWPPPR